MKKLFSQIPCIRGNGLEIKKITQKDAPSLRELVSSEIVYKHEPTFLFEKKYEDINYVIEHLYDEAIEESLLLGIYEDDNFCGIAEMYGYREHIHKISVGYRLLERCWGKGIASRALGLMVDYLYSKTNIEIIQASTLPDNKASAKVLEKNGFSLVVRGSDEDWGFDHPLPTDKWIR